ncbi:flagellar basal body P-ring formation chaperone FlgA [Tatumella sp. JGM118]|uniref:flagellar basal body P-ring formation chaperone FlgA n=1 Tax=Tatumella sp. JGM118 TaxID=2799796 RepID=UPI001BAF2064|nr:flagellar basal body P-ring formation chaperone FlgA [Tatumella sp. JGM118]MBS0909893.1 flagellar basal body P-ring formation protein FlgA [Tatumella sp. JGM118]
MQRLQRKGNFRPGVRGFSCLLMATLTVLLQQTAYSATLPETQATQWVGQHVRAYARQQGWQQVTVRPKVTFFTAENRLRPCLSGLSFSAPVESAPVTRFPLLISCSDPAGNWKVRAEATASITLQAITPSDNLPAGTVLSPDNTQTTQIQLQPGQRPDILTRPEDMMQMALKRPLAAGQPVTLNLLKAPLLIRREQPITLLIRQPDLELSAPGIALQNGVRGALIKVKNSSSGRVIVGKVINEQQVSVRAAE